jgi:hypothetical protein
LINNSEPLIILACNELSRGGGRENGCGIGNPCAMGGGSDNEGVSIGWATENITSKDCIIFSVIAFAISIFPASAKLSSFPGRKIVGPNTVPRFSGVIILTDDCAETTVRN